MDNVVSPTDSGQQTPTPSAPASPVATPQAPPVAATPATPQAPATGAPEDRSNWVPPHRIREVRETLQRQWQQQEAQYKTQLEQYQNQVRALAGLAPPPNQEYDSIRQQFGQVFPGLSKIEEQAEKIQQYVDRMQDLEAAVDYIWKNHGRQSMNRIFEQAEQTLGNPLTDEGKRALHAAFTGWVQSNPEYSQRYVDDPELVNEFWKTLSSTLVDPARRAAVANAAARAPQGLPQDTPAGLPGPAPAPKPGNLDERAANAWAAYQSTARNR